MNIAPGIRDRLVASSPVAAIAGDRIRPSFVGKMELPAISFTVQYDSEPQLSMSGFGIQARVSVDCWSDSYDDSHNLADRVREALSSDVSFTAGDCTVLSLVWRRMEDSISPVSEDIALYGCSVEFDAHVSLL